MKQLKKILSTILVGVLSVNLIDCGPSIEQSNNTNKTSSVEQISSGERTIFQIIDSSESTKSRREEYHKQFVQENPNVEIQYTVLPEDQFRTTVTATIKTGTVPDLFPIPSGIKLSTAIEENLFFPINEYVTNEFLDTFEIGYLNEGITSLNGNVYVIPESANILNSLMFYNKTLFKETGLDPENPPMTWREFIDDNKKITEVSRGKSFGFIEIGKQVNRLEIALRAFSSVAGSKSNDIGIISLVDGNNTFNSQAMKDTFNLYKKLYKDGSIHPSTVNLTVPEARTLFARNQAGFIIQGSWCIPTWRADNPELDFGVMALQVPDDGKKVDNLISEHSNGWVYQQTQKIKN